MNTPTDGHGTDGDDAPKAAPKTKDDAAGATATDNGATGTKATGPEAAAEGAAASAGPAAANTSGADAARSATAPAPRWLRVVSAPVIAPLLLVVLALAAFLPGFSTVPPLDRDEPRFAQAARQMMETGDYVDIRFQEEARHKKPAGIYWLQVAAAQATGYAEKAPIWVHRLPSLAGAVLAVLLTFWAARAFTGPPVAFIAAMLVAVAIVVGVEARLAKADAVLLATIIAAQGALARCWLSARVRQPWSLVFVFWTALAISILVKGPVGVMIVGLTMLTLSLFTRRLRWMLSLRPLFGLPWLLLISLPWFVAIGIVTDGAFYAEAIGRDMLGKVGQGQEGHGAPPGTHLAAMFGTFWPLSALLLPALGPVFHDRRTTVVQFCLAWAIPGWIVFELIATKLPHYTMPLLPALAILTAHGLSRAAIVPPSRILVWIAAVLLAAVPAGLLVASFVGPMTLGVAPSPLGVILCAFAAPAGFYAAVYLVRSRDLLGVAPRVALAALLSYAGVWGAAFPALDPIWISPRLAGAVEREAQCPDPQVMTVGFNEPSFVFLAGTATRLAVVEEATAWLSGEGCRVLVIDRRQEEEFLRQASAAGLAVEVAPERVAGLNINGGKEMDIGIYRRAGR